jgi:hypothetical protein
MAMHWRQKPERVVIGHGKSTPPQPAPHAQGQASLPLPLAVYAGPPPVGLYSSSMLVHAYRAQSPAGE